MATDLLLKHLKRLLSLLYWSALLFWMVLWILLPTSTGEKLLARAKHNVPSSVGDYAATLVVYTSPSILSSLFGLLLLYLKKAYPERRSSRSRTRAESGSKGPWKRFQNLMWTQPLVTRGPLGVATGFDLLAITVVLAGVAWIFLKTLILELRHSDESFQAASLGQFHKEDDSSYLQVSKAHGTMCWSFGTRGIVTIDTLVLPMSRGSPILRAVDIPLEHAVKYHRLLGHVTLTLLSGHGVLSICVFVSTQNASKLLNWPPTGISFLAGIIAFAAGILMWFTALAPIRRRWFELFYVMHHLYLVLFTFLVFHVGPRMSSYTAGGVFLFFIDRFIRMVQSRHSLSLAATKVYPSGAMELKLRKAPGVNYKVLSFVFVKIPCVSRQQWHPFSITSSPLENSPTLTICIKPLGEWTKKLHHILTASDAGSLTTSCPFSNMLFAEGPYGHTSNFFLRYDALFLIAGGIGITPFIAILRDLYYRYQTEERELPKSIQLIWVVKRGSELVLLQDIFPEKRLSNSILHLECHAFLIEHDNQCDKGERSLIDGKDAKNEMIMNFPNVSGKEGSLSPVSATGNDLWVGSLVAVASCATILVMYVFNISTFLHSHEDSKPISSRHIALLFLGSMVVAIIGFGGVVMVAWSLFRNTDCSENHKKLSAYNGDCMPALNFPFPDRENVWNRNLIENTTIMRGRPNLPKYFNAAAECYRGRDVGVLVCGPEILQQSVATECKSHYMNSSESPFYFHSLSFEM